MDVRPTFRLEYANPLHLRPARPMALAGVAMATAVSGTVIGGSTNAINAIVSPVYFVHATIQPRLVANVWKAIIQQGALDGSVTGAVFAFFLAGTIAVVTRTTCTYGYGMAWLGRIVLAVYGWWIVGGIFGVASAKLVPDVFQNIFIFRGVPTDPAQMLRFAWVVGSVLGIRCGAPLSVIAGLVAFRKDWHRMIESKSGDMA